ncbi:hypothetical protein Tco_0552051 [Tanacetum coccineum]
MHTPVDFSAFVMNHLNIDNLTQQHLVGPTLNLLKGSCKSRVELEFHFEECYKAVNDKLDWHNPKGHQYPFDLSKPLPLIKVQVMKRYDYRYVEEIVVRREDDSIQELKEGDFPNLNLRDIEDMLLLLVQKKLLNLLRDVLYDMNVALGMFTRRVVIQKRVEDLQLGVESYHKKINVTRPETFRSNIPDLTPYTPYNNP